MTTAQRVANFFDHKARSFDAIYSGEKSFIGRTWDRLTRRNIGDRLSFTLRALEPIAGKKILDVGCGSGRYGVELAKRGAAEIVGIDLSPQMIELARRVAQQAGVAERCRFLQIDIFALGQDEKFDATIAMGLFDYVDRPLELLRHLRPLTGELLIAAFPARLSFRVPFRKLWLNWNGCPVYFFSRSQVQRLAEDAGFECVELVRRGPIYILVARNPSAVSASSQNLPQSSA